MRCIVCGIEHEFRYRLRHMKEYHPEILHSQSIKGVIAYTSERRKETYKNKENHPMYGKKHNPETCKIIGDKQIGEKNHMWNGGTSFLPYCPKFNKELKLEIMERDNFQCMFPGCLTTQLESLVLYEQSLHIHHIYGDKENCNPELISLCVKHHTKVNKNTKRKEYEKEFLNIIKKGEII